MDGKRELVPCPADGLPGIKDRRKGWKLEESSFGRRVRSAHEKIFGATTKIVRTGNQHWWAG